VQFELTLASYIVSSVPEVSQVARGGPAVVLYDLTACQLGFSTIDAFDDTRTTCLTPVFHSERTLRSALTAGFISSFCIAAKSSFTKSTRIIGSAELLEGAVVA
jgi:hypothetical protein